MYVQISIHSIAGCKIADLIGIYLNKIDVRYEIVLRGAEKDEGSAFHIYVTKFGWCYGEPPSANAFYYISEERAGDIVAYAKSKNLSLKELKKEMSEIIGGSHLAIFLDSLVQA